MRLRTPKPSFSKETVKGAKQTPPTLPFRDNESLKIILPWKSNTYHLEANTRLCDNYFWVCDTHFRDLERRKFIIFSLLVIWVLSFTYTKPCQIQRPFCVFTTEKRLLWSFEKNCSCHQSFHQKRFSTKKTILWKNLKQIVIALLKKNEHQN